MRYLKYLHTSYSVSVLIHFYSKVLTYYLKNVAKKEILQFLLSRLALLESGWIYWRLSEKDYAPAKCYTETIIKHCIL